MELGLSSRICCVRFALEAFMALLAVRFVLQRHDVWSSSSTVVDFFSHQLLGKIALMVKSRKTA